MVKFTIASYEDQHFRSCTIHRSSNVDFIWLILSNDVCFFAEKDADLCVNCGTKPISKPCLLFNPVMDFVLILAKTEGSGHNVACFLQRTTTVYEVQKIMS